MHAHKRNADFPHRLRRQSQCGLDFASLIFLRVCIVLCLCMCCVRCGFIVLRRIGKFDISRNRQSAGHTGCYANQRHAINCKPQLLARRWKEAKDTKTHKHKKHVKRNDALSKYRTFYARIFFRRLKPISSATNVTRVFAIEYSRTLVCGRITHLSIESFKAHSKHTYFRLLTSLPVLCLSVWLASKIFQLKLHRLTVLL